MKNIKRKIQLSLFSVFIFFFMACIPCRAFGTNISIVPSSFTNYQYTESNSEISVPDVSNKTLDEASSLLKKAGFTNITTSELLDDTWEESRWIVVSTKPAAGEKINKTDTIELQIKRICHLYLDIDSSYNLIFARYDIELLLDDKVIATIPNGEKYTDLLDVIEGPHKFKARSAENNDINASKELNVKTDSTFTSTITHSSDEINFTNPSFKEGLIGFEISVPDVTDICLTEALKTLKGLGVKNISSKGDESSIWDNDNWIVMKQNIQPDEVINQYDEIILECSKYESYFEKNISQKNLNSAVLFISPYNYKIVYKDLNSDDITDSISNMSEAEREKWLVEEVYRIHNTRKEIELKIYNPNAEVQTANNNEEKENQLEKTNTSTPAPAPTAPAVDTQREYIKVTVDELKKTLDDNPMRAKETYKGAYIEVSGKLNGVDASQKYISMCGANEVVSFVGAQCYMKNDYQKAQVREMNTGDPVTLRGKCTYVGEMMGYQIDIDSIDGYEPKEVEEIDPNEYIVCSAADLVNDLNNNAAKAKQKYLDHNIEVTGRISDISSKGKSIEIEPANDPYSFTSITCYTKTEELKKKVLDLNKGDIITLRGKCTLVGEVLGYSITVESFK